MTINAKYNILTITVTVIIFVNATKGIQKKPTEKTNDSSDHYLLAATAMRDRGKNTIIKF